MSGQTRAERMAQPLATDVITATAEQHGVCVRPFTMEVGDLDTGELRYIPVPCGSTVESQCGPCARKARALRMAQCREGWHLAEEPQLTAEPPSEDHTALLELRADLVAAVDREPDARLFTGPRGGRISTAVLRDATSWDEVVGQLGYEHLRRHDLRHTGLTWMADAGVPVHHLRPIAGHGSLNTTQRYIHPDRQSVTDAGELLSKHLRAPRRSRLRVV